MVAGSQVPYIITLPMAHSTLEDVGQQKRKIPTDDNGEAITTGSKKKSKLTAKSGKNASSYNKTTSNVKNKTAKKPPPKKNSQKKHQHQPSINEEG